MTHVVEVPELISEEFGADPYRYYRILRQQDRIHQDPPSGWYMLTRFSECADALKNPAFSSKNYETSLEPIHGKTILQLEGSAHAQRRQLVNPFFRGRGLDSWSGVIARVAADVLDQVAAPTAERRAEGLTGKRVDLVRSFTNYYPVDVIANMLGLPVAKHEDFHRWYVSIIAFLSNFANDPVVHEEGHRTQRELAEYVLPLVAERRGVGGTDLISRLCDAEIGGELMTDEEVKAFVSLLLVAGGETTDKSLGSLIRNLLMHRDQFERVTADRSLVDAALAENLRFSPPTQMTMRQTVEDVVVRDTTIPAGSKVLVCQASANRDEERFANPEEFRIGRDDLSVERAFGGAADHVSFGGGRHFCVGAMLARTELDVALNLLMDRFPGMRLVDDYVPQEIGIKTRGPRDLWVDL